VKTSTASNPRARFGLAFNPFTPEAPVSAYRPSSAVEHFIWRVQQLVPHGGFALLCGEVGTGKSVALRLLVDCLQNMREVSVGIFTRPQSLLADFYRELGHLFGVELSPHNRWAGSNVLRARWREHIESTLTRAVLIIDEAQEMKPVVLNELRLLASADLDARSLLTIVLAGDLRLPEKFRSPELIPLGSRIRCRTTLESLPPDQLAERLVHAMTEAGNPSLMTEPLVHTLAEHAGGNLRVLMTMAQELLEHATEENLKQLDDALYFRTFASENRTPAASGARRRR
jgi:type II secretory pathway predicted ATPase ExeA